VSICEGRLWSRLLAAGFAGLGLKTRVEVPRETDGTWRYRGVGIKANLPHEGHVGGEITTMSGWTRMTLWLTGLL
jgi:hypothetical protein